MVELFEVPLEGSPKSHCHPTFNEVVSAENETAKGILQALISGAENVTEGELGTFTEWVDIL